MYVTVKNWKCNRGKNFQPQYVFDYSAVKFLQSLLPLEIQSRSFFGLNPPRRSFPAEHSPE